MSESRVIYGFHAVTSRLRSAPDAVREIYYDAARKDVPRGVADPEKVLPPEVSLKVDTNLPQAVITVSKSKGTQIA